MRHRLTVQALAIALGMAIPSLAAAAAGVQYTPDLIETLEFDNLVCQAAVTVAAFESVVFPRSSVASASMTELPGRVGTNEPT